jgi:hypothetical protein
MASEMMTPLALLIATPSRPKNFNLQVPVACPERQRYRTEYLGVNWRDINLFRRP